MAIVDKHIPRITVTLMLTHRCNLNCIYCYEKNKSSNKVMTIDVMKQIVSSSFEKYKNNFDEIVFDFMGGEPLLEFDAIKELAEWTWNQKWDMPYLFYATTNGTLLDDKKKDWFIKYKERFVLGLSYDGNPHMQDTNRTKSSTSIDLNFFKNTWPFQSIKMTISPETISSLAEGIIYLHEQGINGTFANLAFGVSWEEKHLAEYNKQLKQLVSFYSENNGIQRVSLLNIHLPSIFYPQSNRKYCGAGVGMVFHDFDGKSYPCHLLSPVNLQQKELDQIKNIDYCNADDFAPQECKNCILFNLCPSCCGMNYLYLKSFQKRFPFMCRAIKNQIAANMLLQYKLLINKKNLTIEDKEILESIRKLKQFKILLQCVI